MPREIRAKLPPRPSAGPVRAPYREKVEKLADQKQATAGKLRDAWHALSHGLHPEAPPSHAALVTALESLRDHAGQVSVHELIAKTHQQAGALQAAARSYQALASRMETFAHGEAGVDVAVVGPFEVAARQNLAGRVTDVRNLLELAASPELDGVKKDLAGLEKELHQQLTQLEEAGARPPPPSAFGGKARQSPNEAADHLARLTGTEALAGALKAKAQALAPAAREKFETNLVAMSALVDGASRTPDYSRTGMGWHYPGSILEYRAGQFWTSVMKDSEGRLADTRDQARAALEKAIASPDPAAALERAVQERFLAETGLDARRKPDWAVKPEAVREAVFGELVAPLRALNELVPQMAPDYPQIRPRLREVVDQMGRHVLEGDFASWRRNTPEGKAQLGGLSAAARKALETPLSQEVQGPDGAVLKTADVDGLGLFHVPKIGGPSHGYDYGPHNHLAALSNAHTQAIVVSDSRFPASAARAWLRVLNVEGKPPRLYLEPMERDFIHRELFTDPQEYTLFQSAILEHAVLKAKAMGVKLSVSPHLQPLADQLGLKGRMDSSQYVLERSASHNLASDSLGEHDWVQTGRTLTEPKERYVITP